MKNMRIIKRITTKEITEYISVCPFCKKRIIGSTESQVAYNMLIHLNAKHKENKK